MSNIKQKNKEKKKVKEIKRFLNEKYPNLFNYLSDLESKKQIPFSDYSFVLPCNKKFNK